MQADDLRAGGGIVEIIVHGIFDAGAQMFEGIGFGFDTDAQGQSGITATDFILADFKDNFSHTLIEDTAAAVWLQAWKTKGNGAGCETNFR